MPIPILQYGVKVRDPTTKQFSDLAALRGGQGPQGTTGPGVPAGGTDGDVLVKNGATDYAANWTNTPKLMGNLATIEPTSTVSKPDGYQPGEYLVYNGQLYKVGGTAIGQGETLNPGQGGNINAVDVMSNLTDTGWIVLNSQYLTQYRVKNGWICVSFRLNGETPPETAPYVLGTLPQQYRPTAAMATPSHKLHCMFEVLPDGRVAIEPMTTISGMSYSAYMAASISYPIN